VTVLMDLRHERGGEVGWSVASRWIVCSSVQSRKSGEDATGLEVLVSAGVHVHRANSIKRTKARELSNRVVAVC